MKHSEYSVIIVGSGAAGLYAALKISSSINLPDGILLVTKSKLGESNSRYAQGGIVGVVHQNPQDSVELHVSDTIKAGAGLSDEEVTRYISENSDVVINDLMDLGVNFDKDSSGNINFTLEAAHSFRRILHVGGDATGRGITEALVQAVRKDSNIVIMENAVAADLLINSDNVCNGLIFYNSITNEHEVVYSSATVLATGGLGQLYKYSTNSFGATGDGIDLAYNAGAVIQDIEFVQFHPTALALSPESKNRFLISEAVRGEGAKLIGSDGNEFMANYHDKRELAPRDVVTRAIYNEMKKSNTDNVFLNASVIKGNKLADRFPTISKCCKENGIDITQKPIPVAPAAHYSMGGVKAAVNGQTSIKGLYAIGEVASTRLHGANRLASNSLLECVVCAYELADHLSFANLMIPKILDETIINTINMYEKSVSDTIYNIPELKKSLKNLMWNNVGILRNKDDLLFAYNTIQELKNNFDRKRKCTGKDEYEYRNMLTVADLVITGALKREESRGAHARTDFKLMSDNALHSEQIKENVKEIDYVK